MLKIENLVKRYGDKCAVDHLSLHIRPGELCAFIGHNGAGKTTTLKACCGILSFDEGEILIDGHSIRKESLECKRLLAYLPDNPDLYEYLTGISFLNFICDVYGVDKKTRKERIEHFSQLLELKSELNNPISSYSHGMKQKLALIGALIDEPRLLLLDEPFVGLDPKAAFTLKQHMREMTENGAAIFFSTHVLEVAEKLCNKVAIINHGRLVAQGDMDTVKGDDSLEELFMELVEKE